MSPSTTIYVISPVSFDISLNITEVHIILLQQVWIQQLPNDHTYELISSCFMIIPLLVSLTRISTDDHEGMGDVIGSFLTNCSQAKNPRELLNQDDMVGHAPPLSYLQRSSLGGETHCTSAGVVMPTQQWESPMSSSAESSRSDISSDPTPPTPCTTTKTH